MSQADNIIVTQKPRVVFDVKDSVDKIPEELKQLKQWTLWKWELDTRKGGWTKAPIRINDGRYAKWVNDPANDLSGLEDCIDNLDRWNCDGVNFVLTKDDPFTILDLDDCLDKDGIILDWVDELLRRFDSYCEWSPSGQGIRIIIKASLENEGRKKLMAEGGSIEVFDKAKTMSVTGKSISLTDTIYERQEELTEWHTELFPQVPHLPVKAAVSSFQGLSDTEVINAAFGARNGAETRNLYEATPNGSDDWSSLEMDLMCRLAFYSKDESQLDRLYRSSSLSRDKWDSSRGNSTYGRDTIEKALQRVTNSYEPNYSSSPSRLESQVEVKEEAKKELEIKDNSIVKSMIVDINDLDELPEPLWLIEDILPEKSYSIMVGETGHGKTFIALDMLLSIANGLSYHGHKVKQGLVILIEAEGVAKIKNRKNAWRQGRGLTEVKNTNIITQAIQIADKTELSNLLLEISKLPKNPVLIVIDTYAMCNLGKDESSAKDTGLFNDAIKQIQKATDSAVMVLHHSGISGCERGSTALKAAVDLMLIVSKNGSEIITLKSEKFKDAAPFAPLTFKLEDDLESNSVYPVLTDGSGFSMNYNEIDQKVLDTMLSNEGKAWKAVELQKESGMPSSSFYAAKKRLEACGAVLKTDVGIALVKDYQHKILSNDGDPFATSE